MRYFTILKLLSCFICLICTLDTSMAQVFNIKEFGAKGDGVTNNTTQIQKAIDACATAGGTVYFPAGKWATGTIFLKSNVTIELGTNAEWLAYPQIDLYPWIDPVVNTRMDLVPRRAFIYGYDLQNITIKGEGTINGNGGHEAFQIPGFNTPDRPYGLHIIKCRNVTVQDVTMKNSAFWMQRYLYCDKVRIDNIKVFNHCNRNNDGLDIDSSHDVVISNSIIDASDDAICLKTEGLRSTKNVVITNCIVSSTASAIKLGTGSIGNFENIAISNCVIRPTRSEKVHHEFDLRGGIAGIDLGAVDGGKMQNISITNIVMDSVQTPIFLKFGMRHDRPWKGAEKAKHASYQNIILDNITATNAGSIASSITGYPGHSIENVSLTNINIHTMGLGEASDLNLDVEENAAGYPVNRMFGMSNLPAYGFYLRHVDDIYFQNITLTTDKFDVRHAFVLDDVDGFTLKDFMFQNIGAKPASLIRVLDSKGVRVYGDNKVNNVRDLIEVSGDQSENVALVENRFSGINEPLEVRSLQATPLLTTASKIVVAWDAPINQDGGIYLYEIYRNDALVKKTRSLRYEDISVIGGKKYKYSVISINNKGVRSSPTEVGAKAITDKVKPQIIDHELINGETIEIIFSEKIASSIADVGNITLTNGKIIKSSLDKSQTILTVKVDVLEIGQSYELMINSFKDLSAPGNPVPQTKLQLINSPIIGYWSFDEISQENVQDLSGIGNHGKAKGVELVAGFKGKAASFNGRSSYIDCGNDSSLNLSGDMAVSFWLKLNNPNSPDYLRVLGKRKIWNEPFGYEVECNPSQQRINISGGNTSGSEQGLAQYSFTDQWVHFCGVIKRGQSYWYADGELIGVDKEVAAPRANETNLVIGANPDYKGNMDGSIDELMIFDRALSEAEVQKLMNDAFFK